MKLVKPKTLLRAAPWAVVSSLLLTACPADVLEVSVDPSTAALGMGESGSFTVSVESSSSEEPITLSVSAPAGITASLASDTIEPGEPVSLDVEVARDAEAGDHTVVLTVTRGEQTTSAELTLTVSGLTVTGTVLDYNGLPAEGLEVRIEGVDVTTDAAGSFTFEGVPVPYDVVVHHPGLAAPILAAPSGGGVPVALARVAEVVYAEPFVHVFKGMTTDTLTLEPFPEAFGTDTDSRFGSVDVDFVEAVPADHVARVCVQGIDVELSACSSASSPATMRTVYLNWLGPSEVDVRVHVLVIETDPDGVPLSFPAYGSEDVTVADGIPQAVEVSLGAEPVGSGTLDVSINPPAGFSETMTNLIVHMDEDYALDLGSVEGSLSFSAAVPELGEERYSVVVQAYGGDYNVMSMHWEPGLGSGDAPVITLPAPATLLTPANGAEEVGYASELSVSSSEGATSFLLMPADSDDPFFFISSMEPTATIPDLSDVELGLPSGALYEWMVAQAPHVESPNELGTGWLGGYVDAFTGLGTANPSEPWSLTLNGGRTFVTE